MTMVIFPQIQFYLMILVMVVFVCPSISLVQNKMFHMYSHRAMLTTCFITFLFFVELLPFAKHMLHSSFSFYIQINRRRENKDFPSISLSWADMKQVKITASSPVTSWVIHIILWVALFTGMGCFGKVIFHSTNLIQGQFKETRSFSSIQL